MVSKNHLRRILRAYLYAKDYIRDLSVITEDGTLVFYDSITGSITRSSWIPNLGINQKQLYNKYIDENKMFVISTSEAKESLNERNFLFHLGHRIVDYNRRNENIGIIIMSVDEQMLHNICTGDGQDSVAYSFIVDREGKLVSYKDKDLLGSAMINGEKDKKLQYRDFAIQQNIFDRDSVSIDYVHDDKLNWDIVNVSNQHEVLDEIKQQQGITFTIFSFSVAILIVIIAIPTRELTGSIKSVVRIMQSAEEGRRQERVEIDRKMPSEVKVIAHQYNTTMDRLLESVETERFLSSRAITALATILRYGIDNSNGIVTIREEYEWLKQYLFLQQTRLKDGFESTIEIPPEFMELKVHKLLIQPFVENSFVHGFKNIERKPMLKIKMEMWKTDRLQIVIEDNGTGMPQSVAKQMNQGIFQETEDKNQIGLKNALYRIRLYYEEQAQIQVESKEHQYTRIHITLPVSSEGGRKTV